jgi:hypothetical protein
MPTVARLAPCVAATLRIAASAPSSSEAKKANGRPERGEGRVFESIHLGDDARVDDLGEHRAVDGQRTAGRVHKAELELGSDRRLAGAEAGARHHLGECLEPLLEARSEAPIVVFAELRPVELDTHAHST